MLALHEWQQQIQQAVLTGEPAAALLQSVRRQGVIPAQRLGIYHDAYRLRLTEALHSNFPALARYLGDDAFNALAVEYLTAHPSKHPSIRWFGNAFADFLAQRTPWSDDVVLQELARFEWALRHTVDATDAPILAMDKLTRLSPEQLTMLVLQLQPAANVLYLSANVPLIWQALMDEQPQPKTQPHPQHWLVYRRQDLMAMWRSVNELEAQLINRAMAGINFADLCDNIAEHTHDLDNTPAQAAVFLRNWVDAGLLVDTTIG